MLHWNPFTEDWLDERNWGPLLTPKPKRARAGLVGLRRAFPYEWLSSQNFKKTRHGVAYDLVMSLRRPALLETGLMVQLIARRHPWALQDYLRRLREPSEYVRTAQELAAGLLFSSLGFDVLPDPMNYGEPRGADRKPGPDWAVGLGEEVLTVEVKCPARSAVHRFDARLWPCPDHCNGTRANGAHAPRRELRQSETVPLRGGALLQAH